ncbi:MAG: hypothetical protein ABI759_21865 [Candidatus Solibacter sp.]
MLVTALSGAIAWWRAFSSVTVFDDEGTLMLSIQQFFNGEILYNSVRSVYGPVYYLYQWLPHAVTGAPVSHDGVRLISSVFWVATGLALFLLVYRTTGSLTISLAAHFIGFRILRYIGAEVSHPVEMCTLLLLGIGLAATLRRPAAMAWFGVLAGAAVLTKINFGLLVVASLGIVFTLALPRGGPRRVLWPVVAVGAMALPFLLVAGNISLPWVVRLAFLIAISLASVLRVAGEAEVLPLSWRDLGVALLAGLAAISVIASFVVVHGSTVKGMIDSLIVWPASHFAQSWNLRMPVSRLALVWAAVNLLLAWLASRGRLPDSVVRSLKLALAAAVVILGRPDQCVDLLVVAAPMLWLVTILPPGYPQPRQDSLVRPVFAVLGVLQVLYVYPVAGSQTLFAAVIMVAVAALCLRDTLPWLAARTPFPVRRWAAVAVTLVLFAVNARTALFAYQRFQSMEPLGLPGAVRLRVTPELASSLRRVSAASQACSMLVTQPGMFSLNVFSQRPAPQGINSNIWMLFLDDAEQAAIVRQIQAERSPCVVFNSSLNDWWEERRHLPDRPLTRFLREGFRVQFETGDYRFMVPK